MANINEILARAAALRQETALNSIDPERAGGIMYDTLLALNELWLQQGAALVISKIYASVAAMNADTSPVSDLTGKPIRPGMVVVIASSDSDNGSVYRYNGTSSPRWSLVGKIGNITPEDSLTSDSTQIPLAARQGKVLDGKISQLGQEVDGMTEILEPSTSYVRIEQNVETYVTGFASNSGQFKSIGWSVNYGFYYIPVIVGKTYRVAGKYSGSAGYAGVLFSQNLPVTDEYATVIDQFDVANETYDITYSPENNGYLFVWAGSSSATHIFYEAIIISDVLENMKENIRNLQDSVGFRLDYVPIDVPGGNYITGSCTIAGVFKNIGVSLSYGFRYIQVFSGRKYKVSGQYSGTAGYAGVIFCEHIPQTDDNGIVLDTIEADTETFDISYTPVENGYLFVFDLGGRATINYFIEQGVSDEINAINEEINGIKDDVDAINEEINGIKDDVDAIDGEVLELNAYVIPVDIPFSVYGFIYASDGIIHISGDGTTYRMSDYIAIEKYKILEAVTVGNATIANIAFFDENKTYLPSLTVCNRGKVKDRIDLTLPAYSSVKYVIIGTTNFSSFPNISAQLAPVLSKAEEETIQPLYTKMLCIGDSLTNAANWSALLVDDYNIAESYTKSGAIGMSMADRTGETSIHEAVMALAADPDVDLISIWAGTNDYGSHIAIGDFDTQYSAEVRDTTTFYGAYMDSIEHLLTIYPKARIFLIGTTDRIQRAYSSTDAWTDARDAGLADYVDATKRLAEKYGLPFLDLLRTSGINKFTIPEYSFLQTYPSENPIIEYYLHFNNGFGKQQIASRIAAFIKSIG